MNHRVFLIAALFACMLGVFAVFAQDGVKTAEFELNPPAETFDAVKGGGIFHFSFATGKTEWVPFRRPANIQKLAELEFIYDHERKKTMPDADHSMW